MYETHFFKYNAFSKCDFAATIFLAIYLFFTFILNFNWYFLALSRQEYAEVYVGCFGRDAHVFEWLQEGNDYVVLHGFWELYFFCRSYIRIFNLPVNGDRIVANLTARCVAKGKMVAQTVLFKGQDRRPVLFRTETFMYTGLVTVHQTDGEYDQSTDPLMYPSNKTNYNPDYSNTKIRPILSKPSDSFTQNDLFRTFCQ